MAWRGLVMQGSLLLCTGEKIEKNGGSNEACDHAEGRFALAWTDARQHIAEDNEGTAGDCGDRQEFGGGVSCDASHGVRYNESHKSDAATDGDGPCASYARPQNAPSADLAHIQSKGTRFVVAGEEHIKVAVP